MQKKGEEWEKANVSSVHREQLLFCLQSSTDMMSLSWEQYVWDPFKSTLWMFEGAERSVEIHATPIIEH